MMSRNVRGFMSLFHGEKPVVCKVHGYCLAGGTDMALCSDLSSSRTPPRSATRRRGCGASPTTALWAYPPGSGEGQAAALHRRQPDRHEAVAWGLATEAPPRQDLDARTEALLERIARVPVNQLVMRSCSSTRPSWRRACPALQTLGTFFDGIARHTPEGHAFARRMAEVGHRQAVRERDEPFGDPGRTVTGADRAVFPARIVPPRH